MIPLLLQLMLNQPMSSDMMNRMLGLLCCGMGCLLFCLKRSPSVSRDRCGEINRAAVPLAVGALRHRQDHESVQAIAGYLHSLPCSPEREAALLLLSGASSRDEDPPRRSVGAAERHRLLNELSTVLHHDQRTAQWVRGNRDLD
jgi:hypothetical protein